MASGGFFCQRVIMSLREIFPAFRKTQILGGKLSNNFVRTISQSNRGANNNEPEGTQQDNTLKHSNEEHVNAVETDYRDATSSTENVGDGSSVRSFDSSLATEQNYTSSAGVEGKGTSSCNMARLLVDELGHVYARYKENINVEEILNEQIDEVPEESRATLNKAKELYLNALTAKETSDIGSQVEALPPMVGVSESKVKSVEHNTTRPNHDFLGIKTVYGDLLRPFSTSALKFNKKGSDCDKAKKLPCLQSVAVSSAIPKPAATSKGVCERFCMPCCKPARDPPICFYPYKKPECIKKRPPRPSFSECKMLFDLKAVRPCECQRPLVGSCKKSKESAKCAGK